MIGSSSDMHFVEQLAEAERRRVERHPPGLDAGDVEDVVDQGEQVAGVGVDARQALALRVGDLAGDVVQQHVGVAHDGVERRPELVRHVGEELRLQRRGLLELEVLAPQQLVLLGELGRGLADLALQLVRGLLHLLVEARLLHRLGEVVEDGDDPHHLALLRDDLARRAPRPAAAARSADRPSWISPRSAARRIASARSRRTRSRSRRWRAPGAAADSSSMPGAVNSRSAGGFMRTMLPSGSVTRIGSATELMIRSSRCRSSRASACATRRRR